jgi:type IV secretory pathway VirB4 component
MLGGNGPQRLSHRDLQREDAFGRFQSFEDAVRHAVTLKRMSNVDMFRSILHHVTYRDLAAPLPEPHVRWNHIIACDWQVNGERPMMGEWHLRPIVITVYPNQLLPQLLAPLLEHRGYLTLSIRFRCLSPFEAQKRLEDEKSFWAQSGLGNFTKLLKSFFGWDKADDQDSRKQIQDINDAIAASQDGAPFGTVSTIAIVRDKDPDEADRRAHHLMGILNGKGIFARIETIGAAKAIRSTWPGYLQMKSEEYEANRHKLKMTGYNYADASIPATYWEGTPTIHSAMFPPNTPTPLVCNGSADEPFHFPIRVNGVGHILGIGMTGSGKSTFAAIYADAHLSIPNMRIRWMDNGRSSYIWSQLHNAEYHDIGNIDSPPLCPLALLDTPNGLQWLMGWFERVFYRRRQYELDERGSKDLRNALQDVRMRKNQGVSYWQDGVMHENKECRNLRDLYAALPGGDEQRDRMRSILNEMIEGYGYIFGGQPASTLPNPIVVYELSNLTGAPKYISTPAKELIFQFITDSLGDSPSLIIWDEFWEAIGDDISSGWFERAIRSFRRLNCAFVGLTQSTGEIISSLNYNLLLGNMPGLLLFQMDRADTPLIREALYKLGLNEHEVTRVAGAVPGQFFYKSSIGACAASAWLGPNGKAICASTSYQDITAWHQVAEQYPDRNQRLSAWLHAQSLHQPDAEEASDGL